MGGGADGAAAEFAALVHTWETLRLEKALKSGRPTPGHHPRFIAALARTRCSQETATRIDARIDTLLQGGVAINGGALVGLPHVPLHLRGSLLSHLHVLARLRGETLELAKPAELEGYLERTCSGLLERLLAEWYVEPPSQAVKRGKRDGAGAGVLRATYEATRTKAKKEAKAAKTKAKGTEAA